jgi:hypothetical protein
VPHHSTRVGGRIGGFIGSAGGFASAPLAVLLLGAAAKAIDAGDGSGSDDDDATVGATVSVDRIYGSYIFCLVFTVYIMVSSVIAFSERPGCGPEPPLPPQPAAAEHDLARPVLRLAAEMILKELGGFAEPLRHRPFRLLAIYTTLQSASSFSGFFFLYYLTDVIAPDFVLFGWHLTSDAVTVG